MSMQRESIFDERVVRAREVLPLLEGEARRDAEDLLEICASLDTPTSVALDREEERARAMRALLRLVEVLSRRGAKTIPFATLGRASLAHLSGALRDRDALLVEADAKFLLLGL